MLKEKVIIIVGASGGIGSACAKVFSQHGARLVLAARNKEKLDALKQELESKALIVPTDASKMDDVKKLFDEALEHFGHIDGVVISVGTWHRLSINESSEEAEKQAREDYNTLVLPTYNVGFVAAQLLSKSDGLIVNISSHAAKKPELIGNLYYGPAKAFGTHFMQGLAKELGAAKSKARVVDIQPMIVNTPENAKLLDTPEKRSNAIQPEAIAEWIANNFDNPAVETEKKFETGLVL